MQRVIEKLQRALVSRRSYAFLTAMIVWWLQKNTGLDEETARQLVALILSWIVSDSIAFTGPPEQLRFFQKVGNLLLSMRFWFLLFGFVVALVGSETQAVTAATSALIVGRGIAKRDGR